MERTKEEYQQIYDDLLVLKETLNRLHDIGGLWPTPMNGKTWEEEKDEFWQEERQYVERTVRENST